MGGPDLSARDSRGTLGPDGVFTREWLPAGSARGGFLCLHGMESHSGWFHQTALALVRRGWAVVAADRPGWGESPGERGHIESYRDIVRRVAGQAAGLRERFGSAHLAGMSWGGMAALYFALRRGWLVDSLTLLAPGLAVREGLPFIAGVKTAWAVARRDWLRSFTPAFTPELFSDKPDIRQAVRADPLRVGKVSAAFCLETLKMRRFIRQCAGTRRLPPAQCLLGARDRMIDNDRVRALCEKAGLGVSVVADAAHALVLDAPEAVAERLAGHAERAATARTGKTGKIWVIGGGAVGGALGSLLSFAGHRVGVLVKPRHIRQLPEGTFTLATQGGGRATDGCLALAGEAAALPDHPDLAVVAVKGFDTASALAPIRDRLQRGAVVLSVQNGVANEAIIRDLFPGHAVAAGAIGASLELTAPGRILWPNDRGGLAASAYQGDPERVRDVLERLLPDTGMEYRWIAGERAAERLKWSKLMLNTAFNALNSLTGLSSAAILRDEQLSRQALGALREGFIVMDRMGLRPVDLPGYPVAKLRLLTKLPFGMARRAMAWEAARSTEAAFSMRQDFLNRRGNTEIGELNGAVASHGERLGVETPVNRELVRLVGKKLEESKNL